MDYMSPCLKKKWKEGRKEWREEGTEGWREEGRKGEKDGGRDRNVMNPGKLTVVSSVCGLNPVGTA